LLEGMRLRTGADGPALAAAAAQSH
jgi:hypothetical protein